MQTPQPRLRFPAVHASRNRALRVLVVAGARPNFVKVAPIVAALRARGHGAVLVHTGQHYDAALSGNLFADLDLPAPDHHPGAGSGTHAVQTARVMEAFEPVLLAERPDRVVVVGDVNSTLACALVEAQGGGGVPGRARGGGAAQRRLADARRGEPGAYRTAWRICC